MSRFAKAKKEAGVPGKGRLNFYGVGKLGPNKKNMGRGGDRGPGSEPRQEGEAWKV